MTFYPVRGIIEEDVGPNDFRCIAEIVSAERLIEPEYIASNKLDILTDFLREIAWSFWQSLREFPNDRLNAYADQTLRAIGIA